MKAIIAINNKGVIGKGNSMPWRSSEDLRHFKKLTMGATCLVGRKTYESLPPLKGRHLVVVGTGYFKSIDEAISSMGGKIDWVIGGKSIYEQTMHLIKEFHVSRINDESEGDVFAPSFENFKGAIHRYNFEVNK